MGGLPRVIDRRFCFIVGVELGRRPALLGGPPRGPRSIRLERPVVASLAALLDELAARGIRLFFGNLRDRVKRDIERGLALEGGGDDITFPTVAAAAMALDHTSDGAD